MLLCLEYLGIMFLFSVEHVPLFWLSTILHCTVRCVRVRGRSAILGDAVPQNLEPVANRLRPLNSFLQNRLQKNAREIVVLA